MKNLYLRIIAILLLFVSFTAQADEDVKPTTGDSFVHGQITAENESLPFVSVSIAGSMQGVASDVSGHYHLPDLPKGEITLVVSAVGYKALQKTVNVGEHQDFTIDFDLESDNIGLEQVVVTANRGAENRREASTIVSAISPKLFEATQSVTLSEGLNFTPGLRMENDCQNCGFTQVRMNGLDGPYSQILINSRAIFSGLAGVYGLELIPANMIERVEVIRGGGSALYGSNAIAGTVNLITKDPIKNTYQASYDYAGIGAGTDGDMASDHSANFNFSLVSDNYRSGLSVFGFYRDKEAYDANGDGYSELSNMENKTIGARGFYKTGRRSKLTADYFHIDESRRGGDQFDKAVHEANIAEAVDHSINTAALNWDLYARENDKLSVFASAQHIVRDSYYGAEQDLTAFGESTDLAFSVGAQYVANFDQAIFAPGKLTVGVENNGDQLEDKKIDKTENFNNPNITTVTDQKLNTVGSYVQQEWQLSRLKVSAGVRYDHYSISDEGHDNEDLSGDVFSPRFTLKYDILSNLQARGSYSSGYRVPQVFDEDLHIETSGARKVIHENSADLKQENSQSYSGSLSWAPKVGDVQFEILGEAFYTVLDNPFVNDYGEPDENGVVIYTRTNAEEGAKVKGVNFELNATFNDKLQFQSGFTHQSSKFNDAADNEFGSTREYMRTPNDYGYFSMNYNVNRELVLSANGNYTGKMWVPYFGTSAGEEGELRKSDSFFDFGLKASYTVGLKGGVKLKFDGGVKNLFNSYQDDFDKGVDRDPAYIYGPGSPRTIYFGVQIGNLL